MSNKPDIIERLNNPDTCIDAIDDAIAEITEMREIVEDFATAVTEHNVGKFGDAFARALHHLEKVTSP